MALNDRLVSVVQAIGTDIKSLFAGLSGKQNALVSGTNIKTINGASVLGPGNIVSGDVTTTGVQTLTNKTLSGPILNDLPFAITGTAPSLSPNNGGTQTWNLTANSNPTAGTWASGQSMTLAITGTFAVNWTSIPVTWKTNSGVAPVISGVTFVLLEKIGTTIYGWRCGDA